MIFLRDVGIRFGERILFRDLSASIQPDDRIGLVGANGAGKTTLLRILQNDHEPESGTIDRANDCTVGYLPQEGIGFHGRSVADEARQAFPEVLQLRARFDEQSARLEEMEPDSGPYRDLLHEIGELQHELERLESHKVESRVEQVLFGLGFDAAAVQRDTGTFSGGWQMRIALAKLLLRRPSLLLLDEPTNHLDLPSQRWLEGFLERYEGALLMVSHDRAFLDRLCSRIFHVNHGRLDTYTGNYTAFEKKAEERRQQRQQAALQQEREIAQTERFIERFRYKASKARQVQSRIKALEKVERIQLDSAEKEIHLRFPNPPRSGHEVIKLDSADKAYGDLEVFRDLDFVVERGDRIAVVGPNGAGKSTFARMIAGVEPLTGGTRTVGHQVEVAYYAQQQAETLDTARTALDIIAEATAGRDGMNPRDLLGAFLFSGDDALKRVSVLSGGERCRLALARMLVHPTNLLVLDEPTNHLDMKSIGILGEAIAAYPGTLLIVSHDRAFLDPLVDRVVDIGPNRFEVYPGNVSEYLRMLEERERAESARVAGSGGRSKGQSHAPEPANPKDKRRRAAAVREALGPLKKELDSSEETVASLEEKVAELEGRLADPTVYDDREQWAGLAEEHADAKARLDKAYITWEAAGRAYERARERVGSPA